MAKLFMPSKAKTVLNYPFTRPVQLNDRSTTRPTTACCTLPQYMGFLSANQNHQHAQGWQKWLAFLITARTGSFIVKIIN